MSALTDAWDILIPIATPAKEETCKGLVFRGYINVFKSGGHIGNHQGVKLLKRKSCPGCDRCGWMEESISEAIDSDTLIMPAEVNHGAFYSVRIVNESRDWESGIIDVYDVEIYELPEDSA